MSPENSAEKQNITSRIKDRLTQLREKSRYLGHASLVSVHASLLEALPEPRSIVVTATLGNHTEINTFSLIEQGDLNHVVTEKDTDF